MIPEVSVRTAPPTVPPAFHEDEDEGQIIRKWSGILAHAWGVLAIGAVAGGLLAWLAASRTPPVFEAVSTVVLTPPSDRPGMFMPAGMRTIFTSPTVLSGVVQEFGLDRSPYSLTPETFRTNALIVDEVPTTYLTRFKVRLPDAETAAKAATGVAQRAIELTARIWRDAIASEQAVLERQLTTVRQELTKAEQEWLASRLSTEKDGALTARTRIAVPRGVGPDEGERRSTGSTQKPLEDRLADSRAAGLPEANGQRYLKAFELVRLENEVEVRRKVYMDIAGRLERTRVEVTATPSPLQLVEAAAVPQHPLPGTRKRTIALGLLAGLVLAACVVVSREWRQPARKPVH